MGEKGEGQIWRGMIIGKKKDEGEEESRGRKKRKKRGEGRRGREAKKGLREKGGE